MAQSSDKVTVTLTRERIYLEALVQIANASNGDTNGKSESDYWRDYAKELQQMARDALYL